jgi:hypothetical protein
MFPNDCEVANGKKEDEFGASSLTTVRRTNGHVPFSLRGRAHTSICVREINEANAAAACRCARREALFCHGVSQSSEKCTFQVSLC